MTLPGTAGTSGYVLQTDGTGITSWTSGSAALSALTSAQATNSEDNAAYAQTWTWNSISTQTGLTITQPRPSPAARSLASRIGRVGDIDGLCAERFQQHDGQRL